MHIGFEVPTSQIKNLHLRSSLQMSGKYILENMKLF